MFYSIPHSLVLLAVTLFSQSIDARSIQSPDLTARSPAKPVKQLQATTNNFQGQFYAGACINTLLRHEAIAGRTYYDFDGKTKQDPFVTMAKAGLNVIRVGTQRGQCAGPTKFQGGGSALLGKEINFELDWGCIDIQVKAAQRGIAQGMRVVMTINQGFNITKDMMDLNYQQMVQNVQAETKRQLQPFLKARIVPDIILLENEGSDGILYQEESTGHIRGTNDGKASAEQVNAELCGQRPTGKMNSYPQLAGYHKAEILAAKAAIKAAGLLTNIVRFGLHSHGQYAQWKEGVVHGSGPDRPSQTELKDASGKVCPTNPIPKDLLSRNLSTMLTIAGFSAYPEPMRPDDINSVASQNATLDRLTKTLTQLQGYAEAYGRFKTGPYKGQYRLQGFGVEYATRFDQTKEVEADQALTNLMFKTVKGYKAFLGLMWWEPFYARNNWEGGQAVMSRATGTGDVSGVVPTAMFKTWGSYAVSPFKTKGKI